MSSLDHWIARNGLGGYQFKSVSFRPGAVLTQGFGLGNGYRIVDGLPQFGWARIHTGCDRAQARTGDGVYCPLPNDASTIVDYRGEGYGALVRLTSQEWCYEVRIAHMHPAEDVLPDVRELLERHAPVPMGMRLGRAGRYGVGRGRHTHTELVAWSRGSDMLVELAERLYGYPVHEQEHEEEEVALKEVLEILRTGQKTQEAQTHDLAAKVEKLCDKKQGWREFARMTIPALLTAGAAVAAVVLK